MVAYLSIDLDDLPVDPALARRLPPGLAAYYLAAPLAGEDGFVSVAMAHPENETALVVLRTLFDAPVVPVRAPAAAIRRALKRLDDPTPGYSAPVLVWAGDAATLGMVQTAGELVARPWNTVVTPLAAPEIDLPAALEVARAGQYYLTILAAPEAEAVSWLYEQVSTPILLLRRPVAEWRRILVVLRGFTADCLTLDCLAPLLQASGATVTLLPLPHTPVLEEQPPLALSELEKAHLQDCLRHPALQGAPVFIRFRQGPAPEQAVAEARQGAYDLLAIAAEGFGAFISSILTALDKTGDSQCSFLLLKPPAAHRTAEQQRLHNLNAWRDDRAGEGKADDVHRPGTTD